MKHAYLIMAHNNIYILEKLIQLLDYEKNDIYIHIDKKVQKFDFKKIKKLVCKSNIFFTERIDVRWGDYSQVEAILTLLKKANHINKENKNAWGGYAYYHLLSGVDLPLRPQEEIHEILSKTPDREYIHFAPKTSCEKILYRYKYRYFYTKYLKEKSPKKLLYKIGRLNVLLQRILGMDRLAGKQILLKYGSEWFSITNNLVEYILSKEDWIKKTYINTLIPDESFIQTIVYNSKFYHNVYIQEKDTTEDYRACLRYIDWTRGNPYVWSLSDYKDLMKSEYLFARKFEDKALVDKIYNNIINTL